VVKTAPSVITVPMALRVSHGTRLASPQIANLEAHRVVKSPATVVAQRRVALWRELGCDAVAVDAAADALADRLTRTGQQAPALPLS
jgi:hypothetical protein